MSFDIAIIKSDIKEVSTVAVTKNGKILMGKRRDSGRWTMPGGHLEKDEDPEEGAVRELFEEAGLKINTKELKHLKTQKVVSELGKNLVIHAYEYDDWDGMERPTSKNDPDKEVAKWEWVDYENGLPEEVKNNLHARKNIALIALGLMKGIIMDEQKQEQEVDKGGPGSGLRGHRTESEAFRDTASLSTDKEHRSIFYVSPGRKLKNDIEEDKIRQREEESWKKLMAEAMKNKSKTAQKSIALVVDLLKASRPHKYLRKYRRGDKWIYVYYEGNKKPRRIEDKALKIIQKMAELGDQRARALLDSTQEHPEEKLTALRAAARQGLTSAALKLKNKYGIDHEQEKMEEALIPAVAKPRDLINRPMTEEHKQSLQAGVETAISYMLNRMESYSSDVHAQKINEHGITKESLTEGVFEAGTLEAAMNKLHHNLKKLDAAHEGLTSRNSWASEHGGYANAIYNRTLKVLEAGNVLPNGYADLHKRTNENKNTDLRLTPVAKMQERQRRLEQEARERAEREAAERAERERREAEEIEREEAGLTDTVGYFMASNMIVDLPRRAKVQKAKELNEAIERIFKRPLTKEEFPYNFEAYGLKTKFKTISAGSEVYMDMEIHNENGENIMAGWERRWFTEYGRPVIKNSFMAVKSEYRGGVQIGNIINAAQRKLLRSVPGGGIIKVHANCDVGGYNWANQGFSFINGPSVWRSRFKDYLSEHNIHLSEEQMEAFTEPVHIAMFSDGKKYLINTQQNRRIKLSQSQLDARSLSGVPGEHPLTEEEIREGKSGRMLVNLGKKFLLGESWHGKWDSQNETEASKFADRYYEMREGATKVLSEEYRGILADVREGRASQPVQETPRSAPARPSGPTGTMTSQRMMHYWAPRAGGRSRNIRMTPQRIARIVRWDNDNFNHFILHAPLTRQARASLNEARRRRNSEVPF